MRFLGEVYMPVVVSGADGQTTQKTVEIPQVQFSDKVVGLLVCWHTRRQVPIVLSARKTVEVPKLQFINMPVVQQQVPMVVTVQKPVVIPEVRFLGKVVDMPVVFNDKCPWSRMCGSPWRFHRCPWSCLPRSPWRLHRCSFG